MNGGPWTDDDVKLLRELHEKGCTARQIVGRFADPHSYNSIVGKLFRLHLTRPRLSKPPSIPRAVKRKLKVKKMPKTVMAEDAVLEPDFEPLPPVRSEVWQPLPGTTPVPLLNVTGCLWRVRDDPYLFCNSKKQDGFPYCPTHAAMAYQRAK